MIPRFFCKKNNIVSFPSKLTEVEREIEAIIFAAAEPLSVETIESKISKRTDVEKILHKLNLNYYICKKNQTIYITCLSIVLLRDFKTFFESFALFFLFISLFKPFI